jgi:hypothetical protein
LSTTTTSASGVSTDSLVNSFHALSSIESSDMMQPIHSYFGQPDMSISEGQQKEFFFSLTQVINDH